MRALDSTNQEVKGMFVEIVTTNGLLDADVAVSVTPLPAEQAIGLPNRRR